MGDDDTNIKFEATSFLFSVALMYIALKHSMFLSWAAGLTQPWSGLATVLIWVGTVIGYLNLIAWALVLVLLFALIVVGVFLLLGFVMEKVKNR